MIPRSWLLACLLVATAGAAPRATGPVEFLRVRVPPGRMQELPLGDTRHVPMSAAAFDRAVARLGFGLAHAPEAVVTMASYDAELDAAGQVTGNLEFELGEAELPLIAQVPLGRLDIREATVRTAAGTGHAEVFGSPGGGVAMRVSGAGRYACRFACPPVTGIDSTQRLSLVPALSSAVRLRVPAGMRPVVAAVPAEAVVAIEHEGDAWLVRTGPAEALLVRLVPLDAGQPRVRAWSRATIAGRRADIAVRIEPDRPWLDGQIDLVADAGLTPAEHAGCHSLPTGEAADGRIIRVVVPPRAVGTREPIDLVAAAPIDVGRDRKLPLIRPAAGSWAGGGTTILVDPSLAIESLDLVECHAVGPAEAATWPVAGGGPSTLPTNDGAQPALLHVELQSAAATISLRVVPRPAEIDVARVTTVDVSPGAVVGRATCDVKVRAGEAFGIVAGIAPGWFIDAVEAVEWQIDPPPDDDAEDPSGGTRDEAATDPTRRIDWRVDRGPEASELRIELAEAATRSRSLGLRITGHRRGVPIGGGFVTSDMDMVRFEGESADAVLVDFRVGPEAVIEVGGSPIGILAAEGRLARLVEPGGSRGRIRGGVRAGARDARLVRRRPPLDADVQVQVVARDGQLAESSTFVCRADTGAIDAIVVHFSEPLGETAEWSLLKPEGTTAVPRRLDAVADVGLRPKVAESWVVEFRPAVEESVTFRAARTLPFVDAVPATLAWVEGATEERGTLLVRGAGGVRPAVLNRRLWELPPEPADARDAAGVVAEFRYAGSDSMLAATDGSAAAEIVPVPSAEARAWAWTERTTAWCHKSGGTEFETVFDVENRGRGVLTLSVPRDVRVQEIIVAGEPAAFDVGPTSAAEVRIEVPQDRVRCDVVVRGVTAATSRAGFWWIDPAPFAIDAPVLGRSAAMMLPAELDVLGMLSRERASPGWTARLFDAVATPVAADRGTPGAVGFRRVEAATSGRGRAVCVVRRDLLASLAILTGMLAAAVAAWMAPRHLRAALAAGCITAIAALWLEPPLLTVARAAWWGVLSGLALGVARLPRPAAAACLVAAGLMTSPAARAANLEPYRVYVTEASDGDTVLVPEPLYRMLAADEAGAAAAVQVRHCRVDAARFDQPWSLSLDVESDQGGVLVMRQDDGGRWSTPGDLPPGVAVDVSDDGLVARLVATTPGRRRVRLGAVPGVERRGMVEFRRVTLPAAAAATLAAGEECQCDRTDHGGAWTRVAVGRDGFDVSHARAARLVRSVDPRHPLADDVGEAVSRNDISWSRAGARLSARFEIDAGRSIVRAAVVQASPGLLPTMPATASEALPGDRWLVELPEPRPGRTVIDLDFEMPLASPVGVFDAPAAWLERAAGDARLVRLLADPELEIVPELPPGLALVRQRDADPRVAAVWRSDSVGAAREAVTDAAPLPRRPAAGIASARIAVRRRPAAVAVAQELDLEYAPDQVGMTLEADVESLAGPLTTLPFTVPANVVVDGFSLQERAGEDDRPVEVIVARPTPDRLIAVVQRPRPGRFRLRLAAHVPTSLGRAAPLPVIRCDVAEPAPLAVTWRGTADVRVDVTTGDGKAVTREMPAAAAGLLATVTASETSAEEDRTWEPGSAPPGPDSALGSDLADVSVQVALDGRGRAWGLARFDLAAGRPMVTLRMPAGTRLFDILVDGREARAVPRGGDAWEVALHDIRWPRTILVVFAGDVGGRLERGDAVRLEPPRIDAVVGREVLWSIDGPEGMRLRAVDPTEPLDAMQWRDRGATARTRMAETFDAALENVAGPESGRLAAFARRRRLGEMPTLEASWDRGFAAAVAERSRLLVAAAGDGSVTVRAARGVDATAATRAAATAVVLGLFAIAWAAVSRRPEACREIVRSAWPWALTGVGLAWITMLRPVLPGAAMLVAGGLALAMRLRPPAPVPTAVAAAEASTRTQLRG